MSGDASPKQTGSICSGSTSGPSGACEGAAPRAALPAPASGAPGIRPLNGLGMPLRGVQRPKGVTPRGGAAAASATFSRQAASRGFSFNSVTGWAHARGSQGRHGVQVGTASPTLPASEQFLYSLGRTPCPPNTLLDCFDFCGITAARDPMTGRAYLALRPRKGAANRAGAPPPPPAPVGKDDLKCLADCLAAATNGCQRCSEDEAVVRGIKVKWGCPSASSEDAGIIVIATSTSIEEARSFATGADTIAFAAGGSSGGTDANAESRDGAAVAVGGDGSLPAPGGQPERGGSASASSGSADATASGGRGSDSGGHGGDARSIAPGGAATASGGEGGENPLGVGGNGGDVSGDGKVRNRFPGVGGQGVDGPGRDGRVVE